MVYKEIKPHPALADYIENISISINRSDKEVYEFASIRRISPRGYPLKKY